jgi:hypothetical protein
VAEEPVIYRQEVLTIMGLIGDLTFAAQRLVQLIEAKMAKKRKRTKTDFTQMNEHLRVLRELVAVGWAELKAKAEAEGKPLPVEPPRC